MLVRALLDLVVPARCAGCAVEGADLCPACARALAGPARRADPSPAPAGLPPVYAVAGYDGAARRALLAHKERGARSLAGPLGVALARSVVAALPPPGPPVALVPVPSTRVARRERGDDPLLRLARRAARVLQAAGWSATLARPLRHARAVVDSAGLTAPQRAANLAGALVADPAAAQRVAGCRVVLLDDLVTTGATLAEAARALRAAGVAPAAAAVVAAVTRRRAGGGTGQGLA